MQRTAIYGGTFDPVHNGHLEVARRVLELFELDQVVFVPACVPPHKRTRDISSAWHRYAMLALATGDDPRLRVSTLELDDPQRPYAVDTIARMQDEVSADQRLFFLIGADSWAEITTWHDWQRLMRMSDLIVVTRPGYELQSDAPHENLVDTRGLNREEISKALDRVQSPRVFLSDAAMIEVSATAIRGAARLQDRDKLREMVPAAIAGYIEKYELYKN